MSASGSRLRAASATSIVLSVARASAAGIGASRIGDGVAFAGVDTGDQRVRAPRLRGPCDAIGRRRDGRLVQARDLPPPPPRRRWRSAARPGASSSSSRWTSPASSTSPRVNARLRLDARHQHRKSRNRAREHRVARYRGIGGPRCSSAISACSRPYAVRGNEREAAGAMDAAQRVAGADHRRSRDGVRIELQDRQFVLERARHAGRLRRTGFSTAIATA